MIQITFRPKNYELSIEGHAGQDEKGHDIVCSAVSMLFYTLAQSVLQSEHMMEDGAVFKDEDGDGHILCRPKKEYEANVALMYWTILTGVELIVANYPEYVAFRVEEEQ